MPTEVKRPIRELRSEAENAAYVILGRLHPCKVCQNVPGLDGELEHGKGCYVIRPDGGGFENRISAAVEQAIRMARFIERIRDVDAQLNAAKIIVQRNYVARSEIVRHFTSMDVDVFHNLHSAFDDGFIRQDVYDRIDNLRDLEYRRSLTKTERVQAGSELHVAVDGLAKQRDEAIRLRNENVMELTKLRDRNAILEEQNQRLQQLANEMVAERDAAVARRKEVLEENASLGERNTKLQASCDEMQSRIERWEKADVGLLVSNRDELQRQRDELQRQVSQYQQEIDGYVNGRLKQTTRVVDLELQVSALSAWIEDRKRAPTFGQEPIPMRLHCETCHELHVDVELADKPHHTHACQHCGACWRPALVPTVGVRFLPGFKDAP
jgi:hypothetical protein